MPKSQTTALTWKGVFPAITTPLKPNGAIDHPKLARHCRWMIESGCRGIICGGSLGEAATLSFEEKLAVASTCVKAIGHRSPVVLGITALSTAEGIALAKGARAAGCQGLMVLPPYVYSTEWREMKYHVGAIIGATPLSCMLYNNPVAYKTDFLPKHIKELAGEFPNLHAVKESSGDVRRVTALKAVLGDHLTILVGMDDAVVEGIRMGAEGWVAGLVNAFPKETVALFDAAKIGDEARTRLLYEWFLPLLRLDTVPKFVQHIKWIQEEMRCGTSTVRGPRLPLAGADLALAKQSLEKALAHRPSLGE